MTEANSAQQFGLCLAGTLFLVLLTRMFSAGAVLLLAFNAPAQNLFYTDEDSGNIVEITPAGVQTTFASGLSFPQGLAFGKTGNLFVADNSGNIYKFTPGGAKSTFASGLSTPLGLAFNSAGDLFVANNGNGSLTNGSITQITPGGTQSTFASGLNPRGLAFNSAGDLFEADDNGSIFEFTPGGAKSTFASGLLIPSDVAFNGTSNLFVADIGFGYIFKYSPAGARSSFAPGLLPVALAFNGAGDLFEADGSGKINEFTPRWSGKNFCLWVG